MQGFVLADRSDAEVLAGLKKFAGEERKALAHLIAHLAEMDVRKLYLGEGCASLFKYCTDVLHFSESAAYRRIDVARFARRFPIVFEMLTDGSLHLTAVRLLGPSLTPENHSRLLTAAVHKSREEVEAIVARVRPQPAVPSSIRKLPGSREAEAETSAAHSEMDLGELRPECTDGAGLLAGTVHGPALPEPPSSRLTETLQSSRRTTVSALAPELYKIQFTADAETHQMLRQLQEMMRHQIPSGDPALIIKRGLGLLLDQVSREKFAKVKRPRKSSPKTGVSKGFKNGSSDRTGMQSASRHIPAEVKRAVLSRDQGQCAFVSKKGRRCSERSRLEFHHIEPHGWGGAATVDNIALRCRAHNAYEGENIFGVVRRNGTHVAAKETDGSTGPETSSQVPRLAARLESG